MLFFHTLHLWHQIIESLKANHSYSFFHTSTDVLQSYSSMLLKKEFDFWEQCESEHWSYRGPVGWGWSRGCSPGCEGSCCACPLAWWRPTPWLEGSGRSCCGRAACPGSWNDCRLSAERGQTHTCAIVSLIASEQTWTESNLKTQALCQ